MAESEAPQKKSTLTRWAIGSGLATIGVPLVWAVLTEGLGANAGLIVGWLGVLLVILFVPLGIIVTLVLSVAAVVSANKRKSAVRPATPPQKPEK